MHLTDPGAVNVKGDMFYYAQKFAGGMGRAYIGYSEAMDMMGENASEMDFRLFSMTDDKNIPMFYKDTIVHLKGNEKGRDGSEKVHSPDHSFPKRLLVMMRSTASAYSRLL